jgi:hypothetical protein
VEYLSYLRRLILVNTSPSSEGFFNASGYPMPDLVTLMSAPQNRIPVRPARGSRLAIEIDLARIQEGEIVYARDEDSLYIKDNGVLVNVGSGTGIGDQIVSAKLTWECSIIENQWVFSGPGLEPTFPRPTIFMIRGQRYKFSNLSASDGFLITTTNGTPYSVSMSGNPALAGENIEWQVSMQAPKNLRYVSTANPENTGDIIVISDTFSLGIEDLENVDDTGKSDGDVLVYSESQQIWKAAQLTTGGTTNLEGLTDVNISDPIQDDVLKYNGTYWVAEQEATDPGTAGRKTTVAVTDTRGGQMHGTEFVLGNEAQWSGFGFDIHAGRQGDGPNDWGVTRDISFLESWAPLGRADSTAYSGRFHFDGSGRVVSFANQPIDQVPVSSTTKLSTPQNGAFSMCAFLHSSNCFIHRSGDTIQTYGGRSWYILRIEYERFGGFMPVEYWCSGEGHVKILYGRAVGGFDYEAAPNRNGLVFASRSSDATLGPANSVFPGLQSDEGDYSIEFWFEGSGYNIDDLANVAPSTTNPPRQNFPLIWDVDTWKPGSIVKDGPVSSTSGGNLGIFSVDSQYLYVCVGKNQWKRIALETFS